MIDSRLSLRIPVQEITSMIASAPRFTSIFRLYGPTVIVMLIRFIGISL